MQGAAAMDRIEQPIQVGLARKVCLSPLQPRRHPTEISQILPAASRAGDSLRVAHAVFLSSRSIGSARLGPTVRPMQHPPRHARVVMQYLHPFIWRCTT